MKFLEYKQITDQARNNDCSNINLPRVKFIYSMPMMGIYEICYIPEPTILQLTNYLKSKTEIDCYARAGSYEDIMIERSLKSKFSTNSRCAIIEQLNKNLNDDQELPIKQMQNFYEESVVPAASSFATLFYNIWDFIAGRSNDQQD
jgi:hypothetical protein